MNTLFFYGEAMFKSIHSGKMLFSSGTPSINQATLVVLLQGRENHVKVNTLPVKWMQS